MSPSVFGSAGLTGHRHGTVKAVFLGLQGEQPHLIDPVEAERRFEASQSAAGGRVVTAPTNGAAGIIPAVVDADTRLVADVEDVGVVPACSMAAGGLAPNVGMVEC